MGNLIHVGLFYCLLFVKVSVSLSLGDEDVSDSFLQVLIGKLHAQDKKIAAIEAYTKLDHKYLLSKILMLEEKLKDSDYKQKQLEKTIEKMDNIIRNKNGIKNKENLKDGHFSGKKKEHVNSEPAAVNTPHNVMGDSQDRSVVVESKQKRILTGVYQSRFSTSFIYK